MWLWNRFTNGINNTLWRNPVPVDPVLDKVVDQALESAKVKLKNTPVLGDRRLVKPSAISWCRFAGVGAVSLVLSYQVFNTLVNYHVPWEVAIIPAAAPVVSGVQVMAGEVGQHA